MADGLVFSLVWILYVFGALPKNIGLFYPVWQHQFQWILERSLFTWKSLDLSLTAADKILAFLIQNKTCRCMIKALMEISMLNKTMDRLQLKQ